MPEIYKGHEYEALECRFKDQTELLHRLTLIDLRMFTGIITLQLVLSGWIATKEIQSVTFYPRIGLSLLSLVLTFIAFVLLRNNQKRRQEVTATVVNCCEALGYKTKGLYLKGTQLDSEYKVRLWGTWYNIGVVVAYVGFLIVTFSPWIK